MLRSSPSFQSSGSQSRNTSRSASRSSLVRGAAEENELESYLATFRDGKRAAKKATVDWEELLRGGGSVGRRELGWEELLRGGGSVGRRELGWEELLRGGGSVARRELGFEVGDGGLGERESVFLKPKSREAAGNRSNVNMVPKSKSTASEMYVRGASKRAHSFVKNHHIATSTAELAPLASRSRTLNASDPVEGSSGSVSEVDLTEDTYSDRHGNLLTNIKMADEFLLSEEESQASANGRNKPTIVSSVRSSSNQRGEVVRNQSSAIVDASKSIVDGQVVFPVDHLKTTGARAQGTLLAPQKKESFGDSESEMSSSLAVKLKNVHSLEELELASDSLESTRDNSLAPDPKGVGEESVSTKLRPTITAAESRSNRVSGFRFSAPEFGAMQPRFATDSTVELPNRVQSTPERHEDNRTDTYTCSDDDFESIAEVEEEGVIEEEQHSASEHKVDSCITSQEPIISEKTELKEGTSYEDDFQSDGETRERSLVLASEEEEAGSEGSVEAVSETHSVSSSREQQSVNSEALLQKDHETARTVTRTPGTQDAAVQTPLPVAWPTIGPHYDREHLEPSPIVPHVIGTDALEAATVHSPSNVALNDMLRAQLMLTRQLIASSRQTLENVSANLSSDHHYTTLEDTKDFIARNKPRVLTTREAMQLIRKEEI